VDGLTENQAHADDLRATERRTLTAPALGTFRGEVLPGPGQDTTTPGLSVGTASAVGDFDGSRGPRRPTMVRSHIQRVLEPLAHASGMEEIRRSKPLHHGRDGRIRPGGPLTYVVKPRHADQFTVTVTVGHTGSDVARRVVDREKRHVAITVSDRARRRFVGRALAHELAEATAVLGGAPDGLDVLVARPDGTFDAAALSAHLRGRLAERAWLQARVRSANPVVRARAQRDVEELEAAIGITRLDPHARARVDTLLAEATLADRDRAMVAELAERLDPTALDTADRRDHDVAPDHSTHDEIWVGPSAADGHRRGIGELIPRTAEEAARWGREAKVAFLDTFVGVDLAGYRVSDLSEDGQLWFDVRRDRVVLRLGVQHETGDVGNAVLVFDRHPDGGLSVNVNSLRLHDPDRHQGFTAALLEHLETWATQSGADYLEVTHGSSADAYSMAERGFDWAPDAQDQAEALLARLDDERRILDAKADLVRAWQHDQRSVSVEDIELLLEEHQGLDAAALLAELGRQRRDAVHVLRQARTHAFDSPGFPTPYELSRTGWDGTQDPDATWVGKRVMQGQTWRVVKWLAPASGEAPTTRYRATSARTGLPADRFSGQFAAGTPVPQSHADQNYVVVAEATVPAADLARRQEDAARAVEAARVTAEAARAAAITPWSGAKEISR
ncbi:MAG TPA: hypothetical protein VGR21_11940, partial [Cryptosporangiaceae bacterium]|nr:hypothetical protein [Cryptosporangiaceae bacterium]